MSSGVILLQRPYISFSSPLLLILNLVDNRCDSGLVSVYILFSCWVLTVCYATGFSSLTIALLAGHMTTVCAQLQ